MEEKNAKKKTNILITIFAIVVIVALVLVKHSIDNLIVTISNSQSEVDNSQDYSDDNYDNEIDWEERIDQLEETIKKQAAVIDDVKIKFKNCNAENKTVDIKFSLVPKEYSSDTSAEVIFGNYRQPLKLKNEKFVGSVTVPYDQVFSEFNFRLKTGETKKSATVNADEYSDYEDFSNWDDVLRGNIEASFDGDSSEEVSGNKVTLNAESLNFLIYGDVESGSVPQICISKDGKIVYSCDMKADGKESYSGSIETTVDLIENATYKGFIKYIGKSGLEYRYYFKTYKCNKEEKYVDATFCDTICIYGIDGKEIKFNYVDEE